MGSGENTAVMGAVERARLARGGDIWEVQTDLVAAYFLCNVVQCFDDSETELLALLVFVYDDIFDVANEA